MKRLWLVGFLVVVSSFAFAYSSVIPDPGHGADNVFVYVNGENQELQSAIDLDEFGAHYTGGSHSGNIVSGHGDNIFVRVSGNDKTLQTAINDGSLCTSTAGQSGSYSGNVVFGHKGDDVLIKFGKDEMSLQQAINEGLFGKDCVVPVDCAGSWNYDVAPCSVTACNSVGRYDKQWTTTVSPVGTGTACPNPTFVDNGGNSCSTAACASCYDGIQNQGESKVDCGGPCSACYVAPTTYSLSTVAGVKWAGIGYEKSYYLNYDYCALSGLTTWANTNEIHCKIEKQSVGRWKLTASSYGLSRWCGYSCLDDIDTHVSFSTVAGVKWAGIGQENEYALDYDYCALSGLSTWANTNEIHCKIEKQAVGHWKLTASSDGFSRWCGYNCLNFN